MATASHPTQLRLLLVEDHALVREGFKVLLREVPDLRVVGEASGGYEALQLAQVLRPDLVFMDVTLPGLDGVETTRRLCRAVPGIQVLMLSMHENASTVERALAAGARGYVRKGGDIHELYEAVRTVRRGEVYLSPAIAGFAPRGVPLGGGSEDERRLTARELEVLQLVAEGLTSRQIATRLGVSPKTAENHRANVKEKLGIHTTAGLVRFALGQSPERGGR